MASFPRILIKAEFATTRYISSEGFYYHADENYVEFMSGDTFQFMSGDAMQPVSQTLTGLIKFEGRLLNFPEIEQQIDQVLPNDIELELANADASFSSAEDYAGKTIRIYRYEILTGTLNLWLTGYVDGAQLGPKVVFRCKPKPDAILDTYLPRKCLEASDWAAHPDGAPNGTTIKVPEVDLGKPYQVPIGYFNRLQLVHVYANQSDPNPANHIYDYACEGSVEEFTTVYRANRIIDPSEYSWNDGTDGKYVDPAGRPKAYVRFHRVQKANGQYLEITADGKGLTMGGSTAERNFVNVVKYLLGDSLNGLNQTVDPAGFAASAALAHVAPLKCDGVIGRGGQQQSARDILETTGQGLLPCCFSSLQVMNTGSWQIYTLQPVASSAGTFGACDGAKENVGKVTIEQIDASESISTLRYEFRYNQWEGKYALLTSERAVLNILGARPEQAQLPFVDDSETADRIACFYAKKGLCRHRTVVSGGSDGLSLDLYNRITVIDKVISSDGLAEHINDDFLIVSIAKGVNHFEATCLPYNADIFTYTPGTLPDAPTSDDDPDTTYTPPSAATGLQIDSTGTEQGSDGTTYAYAILSAILPASNAQYLLLGFRLASGNWVWTRGTYSAATGRWSAKCVGMVPGLTYFYGAQAINPANATGYTDGTVAELTNGGSGYTAPGDTTSPVASTISIAALTKTLKLAWSNPTAPDLAEGIIYRGTSADPTTEYARVGAKATQYVDENPGYTTKHYRVRWRDNSGNLSAYSNNVSAAVTGDDPSEGYGGGNGINIDWKAGVISVIGTGSISCSGSLNIAAGGALNISGGSVSVTSQSGILVTSTSGEANLRVRNSLSNVYTFIWCGTTGGVNHGTLGAYGAADTRLYLGCAKGTGAWSEYEDLLCLNGGTDSGGTVRDPAFFPLIDGNVTFGLPNYRLGSVNLMGYLRNYYDATKFVAMWHDASYGYVGTGEYAAGIGLPLVMVAQETTVQKLSNDGRIQFLVPGAFNTGARKTTYSKQLTIKDAAGNVLYIDAYI